MNDVERLLAEYKEAHRSGGEADPERFLSRLSGVEREQLSGLIDAYLERADLVAELAARLGAQSKQEKVASYYHEMEQGRLPASGVSDSVLEALGKIVGYGKDALRSAGGMPAPGGRPHEAGAVYTRTTRREEPEKEAVAPAPPEEWDEVDRLFRAG